jgi:hypothetical protein
MKKEQTMNQILIGALADYLAWLFSGHTNDPGDEQRNWTQFIRCCAARFADCEKPLPPVNELIDAIVVMDSGFRRIPCGRIRREELQPICADVFANWKPTKVIPPKGKPGPKGKNKLTLSTKLIPFPTV